MTGNPIDRTPKSIREQADECARLIAARQAEEKEAKTEDEKSELKQRIQMLRDHEKWLRTRRGYDAD